MTTHALMESPTRLMIVGRSPDSERGVTVPPVDVTTRYSRVTGGRSAVAARSSFWWP